MDGKFDIIEYMSGLTGYIFTKAVLQRIALDRGVDKAESYSEVDPKTRELLLADLLYTAYCSPNVMASASRSHSGMSNSVGSQQIYESEKERLYNMFIGIYKKYDDVKADIIDGATLQWL